MGSKQRKAENITARFRRCAIDPAALRMITETDETNRSLQNESANYLMKIDFAQLDSFAYSRPNFLTASTIDFICSIRGYIECSLKSICCARVSTSWALAFGTTTTPSLSAETISPALTVTPSHATGI